MAVSQEPPQLIALPGQLWQQVCGCSGDHISSPVPALGQPSVSSVLFMLEQAESSRELWGSCSLGL